MKVVLFRGELGMPLSVVTIGCDSGRRTVPGLDRSCLIVRSGVGAGFSSPDILDFKGSWLSLWLDALGAKVTGYALSPPTRPSLFEQANLAASVHSICADVRDFQRA